MIWVVLALSIAAVDVHCQVNENIREGDKLELHCDFRISRSSVEWYKAKGDVTEGSTPDTDKKQWDPITSSFQIPASDNDEQEANIKLNRKWEGRIDDVSYERITSELGRSTLTIETSKSVDRGLYACVVDPKDKKLDPDTIKFSVRILRNGVPVTPSTAPKSSQQTESIGTSAIVGIVCGVAVGAILITVVVVVVLGRMGKIPKCCRKQRVSTPDTTSHTTILNDIDAKDSASVYEELNEVYDEPNAQYTDMTNIDTPQNKMASASKPNYSNAIPPPSSNGYDSLVIDRHKHPMTSKLSENDAEGYLVLEDGMKSDMNEYVEQPDIGTVPHDAYFVLESNDTNVTTPSAPTMTSSDTAYFVLEDGDK